MRSLARLMVLIAAAQLGMVASTAFAHRACCALCKCDSNCNKVCRLVCEEKDVEVTCWGVECEDFCIPGPSCPGCKHCKMVCGPDFRKPDDPCGIAIPFVWKDWKPSTCGNIYTKRKLMRKTTKVKVPSYKWVVEDLCKDCEAQTDAKPAGGGEKK